jgi:dihydrofolate reductase
LPGALAARNLPEALTLAQSLPHPGPVWIGGGATLYREALPLAARVYLTEIHADFRGDRHFPWSLIAEAGFTRVLFTRPGAPGPVRYVFKVLSRPAAPAEAKMGGDPKTTAVEQNQRV